MGNTTQFETTAGTYDTPERARIAKIFAAVIREYLVGAKNKRVIDFDRNEKVVSDFVHPGFDQDELADTMLKTGYRNIQSKTFFSGSSLFMGKDASLPIMDSQKQIS